MKRVAALALLLASCSSSASPEDENLIAWKESIRRGEELERRVGEAVEVEGQVRFSKSGVTIDDLYIDGRPPEGAQGRRYRVRGRLIRKDDFPVFRDTAENRDRAGIPVPEGIDLDLARRRYLIADPVWTPVNP